jgi:hypothetical protein
MALPTLRGKGRCRGSLSRIRTINTAMDGRHSDSWIAWITPRCVNGLLLACRAGEGKTTQMPHPIRPNRP